MGNNCEGCIGCSESNNELKMKYLLLILTLTIAGCELEPELFSSSSSVHYMRLSEYNSMVSYLATLPAVGKADVDSWMSSNGVDRGEYSYYSSGSYSCYIYHWDYWNDGDWLYYVTVDIWTEGGTLRQSMCSYYSD